MNWTETQNNKFQRVGVAFILGAVALALLWAMTACKSFHGPTLNACVVDAVSYQDAAMTQDGHKLAWSRILFVTKSGQQHCFLIFRSQAGCYYSWDRRGAMPLDGIDASNISDVKKVAKTISPLITWAEYEGARK